MKDWMIRAIKTFVQAFFGTLIPAVCTMLSNGWPESWDKMWVVLAPTIAAGLAAAIAAVWNIILEALDSAPLMIDPVQDAHDKQSLDALKSTSGVPADTVRVWVQDKDAKAAKAQTERDRANKDKYGWDGKL